MTISSRKFRMKRGIKCWVFLCLVFVLSVRWIYLKYFNSVSQDDKWRQIERHNSLFIKLKEKKRTKIETLPKDIEENERYPIDITPASIRRKHKEAVRLGYENDLKYVRELQSKRKEVKETNMDTLSNEIEESEIYPIDITYMPASIRKKHEKSLPQAYDDQKYLNELKAMLQEYESSQDIEFEDDFLRSYITSNDYQIDLAFSKIQNFLNLRLEHNYLFHNLSFDFTQYPAYRFVTVLPHRQNDGSVTILFELAKWDPDKVPLEHLKQMMFLIHMQALRNPVTQASGFKTIYDFADAGFRYVKYCTPQNLFLLSHVSFEVAPAKYYGIHLVNMNFVGNFVLKVARMFSPKFIEDILYTHSSGSALLDFFPESMLPAQYGGNLIEYYAEDWIRKANQQHGIYPAGGQRNVF